MAIENFLTSAVGLQQVWTGFGSRATYSAFSKQSTLFHEAEPAPACCSVLSGTRAHCWRVNGIVRAFQVGLQLPAKFVVWRRWRAESIIKWASGLFITYHEWAHFLPWAKRACISFEYFFFSKQSFKYFFIFYILAVQRRCVLRSSSHLPPFVSAGVGSRPRANPASAMDGPMVW